MTYTALFQNSKIDLLVQGIGNDLKDVGHLIGESLDTPAKYLQSAGAALQPKFALSAINALTHTPLSSCGISPF